MAEKKTTKAATEKKVAAEKKTTTRKTVKRAEIVINAENVGFKAGDVYQALAADKKALSVKDIEKIANITEAETLLGIGWLFKEGKIKGENNLITLA